MTEFLTSNSWYRAQRGANNFKLLIDYLSVSDLEKDKLRQLDETELASTLMASDIRFALMPLYDLCFLVVTFQKDLQKYQT